MVIYERKLRVAFEIYYSNMVITCTTIIPLMLYGQFNYVVFVVYFHLRILQYIEILTNLGIL